MNTFKHKMKKYANNRPLPPSVKEKQRTHWHTFLIIPRRCRFTGIHGGGPPASPLFYFCAACLYR